MPITLNQFLAEMGFADVPKARVRFLEAVAAFNARTGGSVKPAEWVAILVRAGVESELSGIFAEPKQISLQTDIESFLGQLKTDIG